MSDIVQTVESKVSGWKKFWRGIGKKLRAFGVWLWKRIVTVSLILWGIIKKGVTFLEDLVTDVNKKADIRVWLGIIGTFIIYDLAMKVPSLIYTGKVFDLVAYGVIISILVGFVLALFGISRRSLDAGLDTNEPTTGIVDEIKTSVTTAINKIGE